MASLNIWVFTEMWFVIIFGSIPTLRRVFMQFSQDIANAIRHRNTEQIQQNEYMETWVQLSELSGSAERRESVSAFPGSLPASACSNGVGKWHSEVRVGRDGGV